MVKSEYRQDHSHQNKIKDEHHSHNTKLKTKAGDNTNPTKTRLSPSAFEG